MLQVVNVNSFEDALRVIDNIDSGVLDQFQLTFGDDFAKIHIQIDGSKYHSSIPAELARGLWEFQEAFYKAAALVLYGVEDVRRLTRDQRKQFELVFTVSEGSTDLWAKFTDFLAALAPGFETMESKHKAVTLISIAVVAAIAWGAVDISEHLKEVKLEQAKASSAAHVATTNEAEKTRQFQILADAVSRGGAPVEAFKKASEKGARAIIESAPDATEITVGQITFDQEEIQDINQRAARDKATASILIDTFSVVNLTPKEGVTRLVLRRPDGSEFGAILEEEGLPAEESQKIWEAGRSRRPITLQLNTTVIRGVIRSATVLGAPHQPPPPPVAVASRD